MWCVRVIDCVCRVYIVCESASAHYTIAEWIVLRNLRSGWTGFDRLKISGILIDPVAVGHCTAFKLMPACWCIHQRTVVRVLVNGKWMLEKCRLSFVQGECRGRWLAPYLCSRYWYALDCYYIAISATSAQPELIVVEQTNETNHLKSMHKLYRTGPDVIGKGFPASGLSTFRKSQC